MLGRKERRLKKGIDMDVQGSVDPKGLFGAFRAELSAEDPVAALRAGLIGKGKPVPGPFGPHPLVYADYVASGRAVTQVERFILDEVLPYYANSHTEASFCGGFVTRLRREARARIAALCGAGPEHAVIFAGSGATAGINRLVALLGVCKAVAEGKRVRVVLGPYEHHSNILPWRESGAEVVEIGEAAAGGPDVGELAHVLRQPADLTICSFSAASNVTGIVTDVASITRVAKAAGAVMVWDYAGAGPYLPIAMRAAEGCEIDALVVSPHKFIGGPGASGVLIVRRDAVVSPTPSWSGGGTVKFVSPSGHDYSDSIEAREEAGTPNVLGDIRAALAFIVKDALGEGAIAARNRALSCRAVTAWSDCERLELLGGTCAERLPIFSFRIRDGGDGYVHQQLVTRLLSDRFGIQARGGCACAGPYVHRLLGIDSTASARMREAILSGEEVRKPGFTRLNFSVLMPDEEVAFILHAVRTLAQDAGDFAQLYDLDAARAIFTPRAAPARAA